MSSQNFITRPGSQSERFATASLGTNAEGKLQQNTGFSTLLLGSDNTAAGSSRTGLDVQYDGSSVASIKYDGSATFASSVSIGGTAAANTIDEYEEGTWTPSITAETGSFTALSVENVKSTYTKTGRIVTVQCFIRTDDYDETGASGDLIVTGLPFASQSGDARTIGSPLLMEFNSEASFTGTFAAYQGGGSTTTVKFARVDEGANSGGANFLQVDQLQTVSNPNRNWIEFSLTYQTA